VGYSNGLYHEGRGHGDFPTLILSPGLGGSGLYWEPNLKALATQFRCIIYDHRGTGRSDREMMGGSSVNAMADDVLGLMDVLELEKVHFMGHAAGGIAGLAMAMKAPDRVEKLVVVNGWGKLDPHFNRCFDTRLALLRDSGPEAYIRAQPIFLYPANWISENDALLEAQAQHHLADFAAIGTMERRIAALRAFDIDTRLPEITVPTLLLAAKDDMLVPSRCSEHLAARMPNARLHMMEWGGHACNITAPDEFLGIVTSWLTAEDN